MPASHPARGAHAQRGAVLMVALMFLVILTMLALTSMTGTTLEERMAGQYRDLNIAFQAAEAGLRDAERDIYGVYNPALAAPGPVRAPTISGRTGFGDGSDTANGACTSGTPASFGRGLCYGRATGPWPPFTSASLATGSDFAVPYGMYTGATPIKFVSAQPVYLIEALWLNIPPGPAKSIAAGPLTTYYRINSRGFGGNPATQVTLQEMYLVPQL
jgi:Tfp pilus assembly protein PilX